jgi:CrcB protein
MGKHILFVGLGGFIGSVARYVISTSITKYFPLSFPLGTFVVNVSGCLVIGIVYGLSSRFGWMTQEWRIFLANRHMRRIHNVLGICVRKLAAYRNF